jgi:rhodanese-related sulfurtransferase
MSFNTFFHTQWPWFFLLGVMVLALFILEYIEKGHGLKVLSMQEGIRLLNNRKTVALDLRDAAAFKQGHITNTKNIAREELLKKSEALIKKKETPVLLICEHNHQARQTGKALKTQGYTDIHILQGGLATWRKENLPLESTHG